MFAEKFTRGMSCLAVLVLCACGTANGAPPDYPSGRWMLGVDGVADKLDENTDQDAVHLDEQTDGGAFQVGFLLSRSFQLRLYLSGAEHGTNADEAKVRLGGATLEAVYLFRPGASFRPYLFGGLGGFQAKTAKGPLSLKTEGGGMTFGAGAHWHLGRVVSLHFSGRVEAINWDSFSSTLVLPDGETVEVETPIDDSGVVGKFTLGLGFWI